MMKRLLTGFLAAGLLTACGKRAPDSPDVRPPARKDDTLTFEAGSPQLAAFRVEPVAEQKIVPLTVTGRLAWNEDATVRVLAPLAGRLVALKARVGARVAAGDLLAEISSPDFGQAQSDAARAATDLAAAERTKDRVARLVERGAAPRKDLDAAEADLSRARAEASRTSARLARWGGGDAATNAARGPDQLFRLTSPIGGIVVERNANPGQEARPDAPAPLFVVSEPRTLWVLLDVTERDLASVEAGDRLALRTDAYPGRTFPGRLDLVGDALDPASRTVKARGSVDNSASLLKAEMYVTVEVESRAAKASVVVPARAVLTEDGRRFCFVADGPARFRRVAVEVGVERDGKVPVVSGLPEGAGVVTDGSLLLASLFASGKSS
jgi:cobalt-zinc-cadmium efflux system membrane fusion protein